jgi:hypothetical protein
MYTLNHNARAFTSLQIILDNCTPRSALTLFGNPSPNGYFDEDAGYEGWDWTFEGPHGVVTLYARWGNLRIGATSLEIAEAFKAWLTEQGLFVS